MAAIYRDNAVTWRLGERVRVGVRPEYRIDVDEQYGPVVLSRGPIGDRWYQPMEHPELPGELAKLRSAPDESLLAFVSTYGCLSAAAGPRDDDTEPWTRPLPGGRRAERWILGDPVWWLRAHAMGAYLCLAITHALRVQMAPARLRAFVENECDGAKYASQPTRPEDVPFPPFTSGVDEVDCGRLPGTTAGERARALRRQILNANLRGIHRSMGVDDTGQDRSFFGFDTVAGAVYWHLANLVDSGVIKHCEADGCGAFFVQTDPRQRYCPKRWRQQESACALRQRQREARHREADDTRAHAAFRRR